MNINSWENIEKKIDNYYSLGFNFSKIEKSIKSKPFFSELLNQEKGKVLNIGCGNGYFDILLAKNGFDVTSIDISSYNIKNGLKLKEKVERLNGIKLSINFIEADVFKFALNSDYYDYVFSESVIGIFNKAERIKVLNKINTALKSKGKLFYSYPNMKNPLLKLLPVKDEVSYKTLPYIDIKEMLDESSKARLAVLSKGAFGVSPFYKQWLTNMSIIPLIEMMNFFFLKINSKRTMFLAPHHYLIAQK